MSGSMLVNQWITHDWQRLKRGIMDSCKDHLQAHLRSITKYMGGGHLKCLLMMLELIAGLKSHPCSPNEAHICLVAFVIFGFMWKTNQTAMVCVCVCLLALCAEMIFISPGAYLCVCVCAARRDCRVLGYKLGKVSLSRRHGDRVTHRRVIWYRLVSPMCVWGEIGFTRISQWAI